MSINTILILIIMKYNVMSNVIQYNNVYIIQ